MLKKGVSMRRSVFSIIKFWHFREVKMPMRETMLMAFKMHKFPQNAGNWILMGTKQTLS